MLMHKGWRHVVAHQLNSAISIQSHEYRPALRAYIYDWTFAPYSERRLRDGH